MNELIALFIYPGIGLAFCLGLGYRLLLSRQLSWSGSAWQMPADRVSWLAAASVILIGVGLIGLPWPWHPWPQRYGWLITWALIEVTVWLTLLPALQAGAPRLVRAATREAQIGMAGRAVLWAVVAPGLTSSDAVTAWSLAGHLLVLLAGLVTLPAALNWGPFGPEPSLGPQGVIGGLATRPATALIFAGDARSAALISAVWLAGTPREFVPAWATLLIVSAGGIATALALSWLTGRVPRLSVPAALRSILIWSGSLAILAFIAFGAGPSS